MRALFALLAVAVVTAAGVSAAPQATQTVACAQVWSSFNVQLLGDRDAGEYYYLNELGSVGVPDARSAIVVWSIGGELSGGLNVYSWATTTRSKPSPKCTAVRTPQKPPSPTGLGPKTHVKDGWFLGRRFVCLEGGRILITTTRTGSKTRVVVRMQRGGKVIAVGELGSAGGWIRGSKTCEEQAK